MNMRAEGMRIDAAIGNAERPSNLIYKVTSQSTYWYMYALMDWYKSEVSCFSTIINRASTELTKDGLEFKPKFALKCEDCGHMLKSIMKDKESLAETEAGLRGFINLWVRPAIPTPAIVLL